MIETHQNDGPGFISTARVGLLAYLWLDTKEIAILDLKALQLWWGLEEPTDYREVVARNAKGEISKSRVIPFSSLRFVPYKRATLPLDDPGAFLSLN